MNKQKILIKINGEWYLTRIYDLPNVLGVEWDTMRAITPYYDAHSTPITEGDIVKVNGKTEKVEYDPVFGFTPMSLLHEDQTVGGMVDIQMDNVVVVGCPIQDPGVFLKLVQEDELRTVSRIDRGE